MNLNDLKSHITRLANKPMVRGTLWMLIARGLRLVLQAAYFVIIARALGVEQYGAFVGVTALVAIVAPFVSWGCGDLLIKHVSRNRALFNDYWGNALFMVISSGLALLVVVLLSSQVLFPKSISPLVVVLIAVSDLIFLRILDTAGRAFMAVDRLDIAAQMSILGTLKSLVAAVCLISFFQKPDLLIWAFLYSSSTLVAALISFLLVHYKLGAPKLALLRLKPEIAEGFFFSIGLSAQTIYTDIDKTMLARFATLEATGIYAAAYRLIDVSFAPISSLSGAAYAKFFQQGENGINGTMQLAKRLSRPAGLYGIAAGIGLLLFAPIVPYVLGDEYAGAVEALRWLAPIPFLRGLQYFGADALTGAGFQGIRSATQIGVALFNVLINLWLIPRYSWKGAAWSSLASDGLLMVILWVVVFLLHRHQSRQRKETES